jgi:mannose-6-phosphate isomerase class I
MCVEGSFELEYEDGSEKIQKGETILVPNTINNLQLKPLHRGKLLEISMP